MESSLVTQLPESQPETRAKKNRALAHAPFVATLGQVEVIDFDLGRRLPFVRVVAAGDDPTQVEIEVLRAGKVGRSLRVVDLGVVTGAGVVECRSAFLQASISQHLFSMLNWQKDEKRTIVNVSSPRMVVT